MATPIKVSTKTNCIQRLNNLLHSNLEDNSNTDSSLMQLTQEGFSSSTDYRVVYKNFDYTKSYDTWIYERK